MKRFFKMTVFFAVAWLVAGCSTTSGSGAAQTVRYFCDDGSTISAAYFRHGRQGAEFAVLEWKGKEYGLTRALSASGARYATLSGSSEAVHGLEWWEAKGEARLSAFTGKDFFDSRPLLTGCRARL